MQNMTLFGYVIMVYLPIKAEFNEVAIGDSVFSAESYRSSYYIGSCI